MKALFQQLEKILQCGEDMVLVTVVASSGSVPRGAGARMLVTKEGRVEGTIGGGAVEYTCIKRAKEVLKKKISHEEQFWLRENQVQDLGMICGGDVKIYFHYLDSANRQIQEAVEGIVDVYRNGEESWLLQDMTGDTEGEKAEKDIPGTRREAVRKDKAGTKNKAGAKNTAGSLAVIRRDKSSRGMEVPDEAYTFLGTEPVQFTAGNRCYYCEKLVQAGRVYVFGGGHVAQALVPVLAAVEFRCVVLEDREEFCRPELFPKAEEVRLVDMKCPETYGQIGKEDFVCIMTRGHKDDLTVQAQVLRTPASYVGVIGSRRKKEGVFACLREQGFTEDDLKRIKTPIGLEIQAETPAEIAVSIAAELILHRAERRRNCN